MEIGGKVVWRIGRRIGSELETGKIIYGRGSGAHMIIVGWNPGGFEMERMILWFGRVWMDFKVFMFIKCFPYFVEGRLEVIRGNRRFRNKFETQTKDR